MSSSLSIVVCIFVAVGTRLPSRCLVTTVASDSNIPTFRHPVTFNLKVTGCGVLYPVQIIANTQYVVKSSRQLALPITFFFQNKDNKLNIGYTFLFYGIKLTITVLYIFSSLQIQNDRTAKSMEQSPSLEVCCHSGSPEYNLPFMQL
jgi:hypothetical protein